MKTPRVTVLLCVRNGGRFLLPALESVLAQTWRDFELLVIDDASDDGSAALVGVLTDARVRLIRLPENLGLTRSLNVGLREARGELVARQDADDLSAPDRLERQVRFLDAHPEAPLVGAQAWLIDAEGRSRGRRDLPLEPAAVRWLSLLDNPVIHTAAMFRAAVIRDECGGYDESFPCCQDYALWGRVLEKYPIFNLPERLVSVREHGTSISATRQTEARVMVRRVVQRLGEFWELGLTETEVDLLCRFRTHLTPAEVAPFHRLLARLEAAPNWRFSRGDEDLQRTQALAFARIGYNLLTQDRALAVAELRRAVRVWPRLVRRLPWLRMLALFAAGDQARIWFSRMAASCRPRTARE